MSKPRKAQAGKRPPAAPAAAVKARPFSPILFLVGILLLTFVIYLPVFDNGLLAWDDNNYIRDNSLIYSFDLGKIFTTDVMGNYHPLTILVMSVTYHLFGLSPDGFHGVNLLSHVLNTALVFFVIRKLSRQDIIALVAALLFGIHPIHVESVAWAAELKDLLYTFFFLSAYRVYLSYMNKPGAGQYLLCLLLFGLAMLSKAMAASLPVVLLLTDFFCRRKISFRVVLEKVPFVLLAVGLGIMAVIAQKTQSNPAEYVFPVSDRIFYAGASFLEYLGKLILPLHLYAHYAYPVLSGQPVPGQMILYCMLSFLVVAFAFYSLRKGRTLFFRSGFFCDHYFSCVAIIARGRRAHGRPLCLCSLHWYFLPCRCRHVPVDPT
jgi:hypothetical protein